MPKIKTYKIEFPCLRPEHCSEARHSFLIEGTSASDIVYYFIEQLLSLDKLVTVTEVDGKLTGVAVGAALLGLEVGPHDAEAGGLPFIKYEERADYIDPNPNPFSGLPDSMLRMITESQTPN